MIDTLAAVRAEVIEWLGGENVSETRIDSAINDAIQTFWKAAILAVLNIFMNGPVNLSISSGDEREQLVTVADPVVATLVTPVSSGALGAHFGNVVYTLVTESGSETLPSPLVAYNVNNNQVASVGSPAFAAGAFGWNCYATSSLNVGNTQYAKQNEEPIPFGMAFQEPDTGFIGAPVDGPLVPTQNTTGDNIAFIRHLEFKLPTGMYMPFDAGDLDSTMMRRFSSIIATPSPYQQYGWDLINQRQFEIRPAAGSSFTPRYFYIQKPRRLLFDNSPIPFIVIDATKYLRTQALSDVFLSLHEYDAAAAWEVKADKELLSSLRALTQINTNRNEFVTPYRG